MNFPFNKPKNKDLALKIAREIIKQKPETFEELEKIKNKICETEKIPTISNIEVLRTGIGFPENIIKLLQKRKVRTQSGVAVITILTKPFSCPGKCVFCPQEIAGEKGETLFEQDAKDKKNADAIPSEYKKSGNDVMPKSYFSNEPAASRALLADFDPFTQVKSRLKSLTLTGHDTSKIELIILGGTFSDLPNDYREEFVTRALQALNQDDENREVDLGQAQKENENSDHRCIALVIETRPDYINKEEVKFLRELGCTKVELGVQSTDDEALELCKRGHGRKESVDAVKMLKDTGFKIGYHVMPGLPGSDPEKDIQVFKEIFEHDDFKPDFLKIYPCTVAPFSELAEWYKSGKYQPLTEKELFPLLMEIKKMCPPWVRISRLVRDIPATSILAGSKTTNMRQHLLEELKKKGEKCNCIRCREIKGEDFKEANFICREFGASGGKEFFLSYETENDKLLTLLRLRIPSKNKPIFEELENVALIRELHTYGEVVPVGVKKEKKAQHSGLGKKLVEQAEKIAKEKFGYQKMAVISGIGVKNYWRKLGYLDQGLYLVKDL